MDFFKERHFSIDPGKGKKMDGCPYSIFEDGRDVKEYIIPPKGYVFKGFHFDPDASNQIYDGKLIAEYEKESFNDVVKSNLWKVLMAVVIIAVITGVVLLAMSVFKNPKTSRPTPEPKPIIVVGDTMTQSDSLVETSPDTTMADESNHTEITTEDPSIETPATTDEIIKPQDNPQTAVNDSSVSFQKDFWNLIHQRTLLMNPYDLLYKDNKATASGDEFDYLRFEILKNTPHFKEWSAKLRKIPATELESINTINELKNKINEIEP